LRACPALLLLCPLLFLGCGENDQGRAADNRVALEFWVGWTGFEADAMQAVVDDFNASQERVFVKMLAVSQVEQKILLATAGGNPPDVVGLLSYNVSTYAENGALTPLDKRIDAAGISKSDYIPALWEMCGHRGYMWALPATPATIALHWNRRLFKEAGLEDATGISIFERQVEFPLDHRPGHHSQGASASGCGFPGQAKKRSDQLVLADDRQRPVRTPVCGLIPPDPAIKG